LDEPNDDATIMRQNKKGKKQEPGAELNVRTRWKQDARSGRCFSSSFARSKTAVPAKAGKETGNMGGGEKRKKEKADKRSRRRSGRNTPTGFLPSFLLLAI